MSFFEKKILTNVTDKNVIFSAKKSRKNTLARYLL